MLVDAVQFVAEIVEVGRPAVGLFQGAPVLLRPAWVGDLDLADGLPEPSGPADRDTEQVAVTARASSAARPLWTPSVRRCRRDTTRVRRGPTSGPPHPGNPAPAAGCVGVRGRGRGRQRTRRGARPGGPGGSRQLRGSAARRGRTACRETCSWRSMSSTTARGRAAMSSLPVRSTHATTLRLTPSASQAAPNSRRRLAGVLATAHIGAARTVTARTWTSTPSATSRAIVPPQPRVSSSGWAATTSTCRPGVRPKALMASRRRWVWPGGSAQCWAGSRAGGRRRRGTSRRPPTVGVEQRAWVPCGWHGDIGEGCRGGR